MSGKMIDLRKRAEERFARRGALPSRSTADGRSVLAHELEVTRIELDMQQEEIALQRSEAEASRDRYAALWDHAPVGLVMLDAWSRILDGNETAKRILGLQRRFGYRGELGMLLHWRDADRLREKLRAAERSVMEVQVCPDRGQPFDAMLVLDPVLEQPGRFRAAIVVTHARGQVDQPATAEPADETAAVSVVVVDDDHSNRALAMAVLEDRGYRVLAASGGEVAIELVAAERPACILMDIRMPRMDGITACECIRALPGGSEIAIVFVTAQRDVDTFDRALAAGGDDFITKPFRPEELLVRVQTALRLRRIQAERSDLYMQLKQQRDALLRLELQKAQLVEFLVHDLKNPVHAIDLHASNALRAGDHEHSQRAVTRIGEETRALLRMITNLLDISRADEGQLAPAMREVDAVALVDLVVHELLSSAQYAGLHIQTSITASRFHADPDLIARVLTNLLDNAIRHAPRNSAIGVTLGTSGAGVELRVADAGPGVPPERRSTVFERFQFGKSAATPTNRGLGLAFCKLAVEAHRGRIWIEDASPGAVFCVSLPDGS